MPLAFVSGGEGAGPDLAAGATISRATDSGNFSLLLGATVVMATIVVTINRLLWRRLYVLASTKYKLET